MNKPTWITFAIAIVFALTASTDYCFASDADGTSADDWPQWRYDAGRGAVAPTRLPDDLHLRWTRQLPTPRPAWPKSQPSLRFDVSYSPVAAGKLLFVPSMVNDSVTAYDTESGREAWRFTTDGPVRFAPLVHAGRVYFGSDDGHLYCVDADKGTLVWKVRGGPGERNILGNERLISTWPVRGGPVLLDDTIYFTSGVWPFMGIFVRAVNAGTGEQVWTNSRESSTYQTHPHSSPAFGGIAPRGYLAATEHGVVVPGGRTPPGCFDTRTGELISFEYIKKGGRGWHAAAHDRWYLANNAVISMADGKPVAALEAVLIDAETAYGLDARGIFARPLDLDKLSAENGAEETLWKFADGERPERLFIKADSRFVAGGSGEVALIEAAPGDDKAEIVWKSPLEGTPWSVLAADGKLFVVTVEGRIHCFGSKAGTPKTYEAPEARPEAKPPTTATATTARQMLEASKVPGGYGVCFGLDDGKLVEGLLRESRLQLIVIDPNAKKIEAFRRRMQDAGLYGTRVSARIGNPAMYSLPPHVASLVVVGNSNVDKAGVKAALKVLRPHGGAAFIKGRGTGIPACLEAALKEAGKNARPTDGSAEKKVDCSAFGDGWTMVVYQDALPGSADWTHQYGDAANTVVSADSRVKAPLGLLWFGNGPPNDEVLPRHGHGPAPQVAAGRLVIEGADMLRALDIYTGRLLWQKNLPKLGEFHDNTAHQAGAGEIGANYVTTADTVYVVNGDSILALDAATGRERDRFQLKPTADNPQPNWGYIGVSENLLIATSTPVALKEGKPAVREADTLVDYLPLIKRNADWRYLTGADPDGKWTTTDFADKSWKTGTAGFGYGDGDDKTVLDMHGKHARLYIRKTFDGKAAMNSPEMALAINYDDAFIAYLNGREVLRVGVGGGRGPTAEKITSHEADGHEMFPIDGFRKLLNPGRNVLGIEGHNAGIASSDFTLDPYLVVKKTGLEDKRAERPLTPVKYSSASRRLVVMDRMSGKIHWQRDSKYGFRHNNIAIGAGKLFCIDGLSRAKQDALRRRGQLDDSYAPKLLALDLESGDGIWSTEKDVFGTFLSYSAEHDVLLQSGSFARDRAVDESPAGAVAYRGADGEVLWKDLKRKIVGPCLLLGDTVIVQDSSAFDLLTGETRLRRHPLTDRPLPWSYSRKYGCNTIVGSRHLLTFRSAAAGYFDLARDGGTGNLGGFKSGCTSNLVVAGGLLNAPEYTRTCTCNYQNQTSLAMIHDPMVETWTFNAMKWDGHPVRRVGINFGAPGDRRADAGTLWLDYPSRGGTSPDLPLTIEPEDVEYPLHHSSLIKAEPTAGELAWVAASAVEDLRTLSLTLASDKEPRKYTVRLHFAELGNAQPGDRVFSVEVQGKRIDKALDIVKRTGTGKRAMVMEVPGVEVSGTLKVSLQPTLQSKLPPLLSGVEAIAEP